MPASLDLQNDNETAAFVDTDERLDSWHRLGLKLRGLLLTAVQGLEKIGRPTVEQIQLPYPNPEWGLSPVYALVRTDVMPVHMYGSVKRDYFHVDPTMFCEALDQASGNRNINTLGLLDTGKLFVCYDLGLHTIAGEEANLYMTFGNDMSGSAANDCFTSAVRTVCANTYGMGLSRAQSRMAVSHDSDAIKKTMEWAAMTFRQAHDYTDVLAEVADILNAKLATPEVHETIMNVAIPFPKEPRPDAFGIYSEEKQKVYRASVDRAVAQRMTVGRLYDGEMTGYDQLSNRGSQWHLYQAVVEGLEHVIAARGTDDRAMAFCDGIRRQRVEATLNTLLNLN